MYSAAYSTVHYKEPLKSFEIRVGRRPGFGLPSVSILPWLCRKWRKAIFTPWCSNIFSRSKTAAEIHTTVIVWSLCDREVACSVSDRQGTNLESCVWRAVSNHSSHHPQEVLLAQFNLYVLKRGPKPHSFICTYTCRLRLYSKFVLIFIVNIRCRLRHFVWDASLTIDYTNRLAILSKIVLLINKHVQFGAHKTSCCRK